MEYFIKFGCGDKNDGFRLKLKVYTKPELQNFEPVSLARLNHLLNVRAFTYNCCDTKLRFGNMEKNMYRTNLVDVYLDDELYKSFDVFSFSVSVSSVLFIPMKYFNGLTEFNLISRNSIANFVLSFLDESDIMKACRYDIYAKQKREVVEECSDDDDEIKTIIVYDMYMKDKTTGKEEFVGEYDSDAAYKFYDEPVRNIYRGIVSYD